MKGFKTLVLAVALAASSNAFAATSMYCTGMDAGSQERFTLPSSLTKVGTVSGKGVYFSDLGSESVLLSIMDEKNTYLNIIVNPDFFHLSQRIHVEGELVSLMLECNGI